MRTESSEERELNRLRGERLVAGYGDVEVLHGIDFVLPMQGVIALVGPGGSGKTTLLRLVAERRIPGMWWTGRLSPADLSVDFLPQPPIPRPIGGKSGTNSWSDHGLQLARILGSAREMLVLDEPVDVMDASYQEDFATALRSTWHGRPVLLATHNLSFLRKVADHVLLLVEGHLIESATVDNFFERPQHERTRGFLRTGS